MIIKNPVICELRKSSDPFITYYNGIYYACYTDNNGVYVSFCDGLDKLGDATEIQVWKNTTGKPLQWYAPELHKIGDYWYIYGAPDGIEGYTTHTMSVLKSVSDDPKGPYTFEGMIKGMENMWSIDGTPLYFGNKMYMVYSNSDIVIVEMSDPVTAVGEHHILTKPVEPWETVMSPIAEGPCILQYDGKLHILYSASDSQCDDYCLALLTYKGGEICDAASWQKSDGPVFKKTDGIYGPGHCSVTTAQINGKQTDILVYHANLESGSGWNGRSVWLKPFKWQDGYPIFGKPEFEIEI